MAVKGKHTNNINVDITLYCLFNTGLVDFINEYQYYVEVLSVGSCISFELNSRY